MGRLTARNPDKQVHRENGRNSDRQAGRQNGKYTARKIDRLACRHLYTQTGRLIHTERKINRQVQRQKGK